MYYKFDISLNRILYETSPCRETSHIDDVMDETYPAPCSWCILVQLILAWHCQIRIEKFPTRYRYSKQLQKEKIALQSRIL